MSPPQDPVSGDLEIWAAAVAHELGTPLTVLSAEVDLALRRDRSPAAYRDALAHIAAAVKELVELTGDLAFLGQPGDAELLPAKTASLDTILARVRDRYASKVDMPFAVERVATAVKVAGDEALLTRAVTLVVEHAVRHCRGGTHVRLRTASAEKSSTDFGRVELIVEAAAGAFWPQTWQCLAAMPRNGDAAARLTTGPLRLRTADCIVSRCGGSLHADSADGTGGAHIRLRRAESA